MAKRKKFALPDLVAEDLMLAQEDFAETRPALAMAPELVAQNLALVRKRRAKSTKKAKSARKATKAAKPAAKTARKPPTKKTGRGSAKGRSTASKGRR